MGIRDNQHKLQYEPVLLKPINALEVNRFDAGFCSIDASAYSNYLISAADKSVYYVGPKTLPKFGDSDSEADEIDLSENEEDRVN